MPKKISPKQLENFLREYFQQHPFTMEIHAEKRFLGKVVLTRSVLKDKSKYSHDSSTVDHVATVIEEAPAFKCSPPA